MKKLILLLAVLLSSCAEQIEAEQQEELQGSTVVLECDKLNSNLNPLTYSTNLEGLPKCFDIDTNKQYILLPVE